jgi:hypothetical protein
MDISTKVRVLIAERNSKKKEVALAIGNSPALFSHKLSGKVAFSIDELFMLCDYFQISPNDFYKGAAS